METWKSDAMHDRPLIVQYRKNRPISDTAAAVTAFNSKLQENMAIIGADPSITFHYFRSLLSNQASQLGADYLDVTHGIGHGSAYTKNYQVTVGTMTLFYAGYKHLDDAEKMGAWVQALYQELDGLCRTLVDLLYAQWAPNGAQLLALEKEVAAVLASGVDQTTGAGKAAKRMSRWLKMVRLCIASWIVSCAARPRDRYSWIDEASPTKRELVDSELRTHLEPIFRTDEYARMAAIVRQKEEEEISMGELAHRTGTECRSRSQMTGMERRLVDLPSRLAESVQPRIDENEEFALDRDYWISLHEDHPLKRTLTSLTDPFGDLSAAQAASLRASRLQHLERSKQASRQLGSLDAFGTIEQSARTCDRCIAIGAKGTCKGHGKPNDAAATSTTASTSTLAITASANNTNASTTSVLLQSSALEVAAISESPSRVPFSALADPIIDISRTTPQTLEQLTSIRQVVRLWLSAIAPLERRGPAHGPAWRSTMTLGKTDMRKWAHQINHNYYPILFFVMEKYESGMGLVEAADAVEKDKGGAEWSAFLHELPIRIHHPKREYYTEMLLDRDGKLAAELTTIAVTKSVTPATAPPEMSASADEAAAPSISEVEGAIRYLAFDPALSCGWAIIQVKEGRLMSVDCGVIQVDTSSTVLGDRLNDLKLQIQPLLTPAPSIVFVESYHGQNSQHRREQTDVISYSLRAVIAMEASSRGITLEEVAPQSWKVAIGVAGNEADKSAIQAKLEATFGESFPAKMPNPNGGRAINFKHDASDATGIGLWGVRKHHLALSFAAPVPISMPSLYRQTTTGVGTAPRTKRSSPSANAPVHAASPTVTSAMDGGDDGGSLGEGGSDDGNPVKMPSKRSRVDFNDILNRRVKKTFPGHGDFLGTIVSWDADEQWYAIKYDDETTADVTRATALRLIKRFEEEESS